MGGGRADSRGDSRGGRGSRGCLVCGVGGILLQLRRLEPAAVGLCSLAQLCSRVSGFLPNYTTLGLDSPTPGNL